MKGSLFDDDDPDPRPKPAVKELPTSRRGRFTLPEQKTGVEDLKDAIKSGDSFVLSRTMGLALYRLGAEPLNKLAAEMLALMEGQSQCRPTIPTVGSRP